MEGRRSFIRKGLLGMAATTLAGIGTALPALEAVSVNHPQSTGDLKKIPGGLWSVMLTPFRDNLAIDNPALEKLTEFYIGTGANGLFANCASSEMYELSPEERLQIIRTTLKIAEGKVPVVASGTFTHSVNQNAEFIKQVHDTGVDAVVLISSIIARRDENDDKLKQKIEQLLKLTGNIPLGIYECPSPYKRLLSPELMKWLGESGRFVYHKDTSCDPDAIRLKIKAVENTSLSFFNADTPTALSSLQDGGAGLSPIAANCHPELYVELIKMVNRRENGERLSWLNARLTVMDGTAGMMYPVLAKVFLQLRGLPIKPISRRRRAGGITKDAYLRMKALKDMFEDTMIQLKG